MAKHNSRGARLTALALATGTLVVAATGSAGAAPVSVPDVFGGSASASAIHIEVNLPVPLTVPGVGTITGFVQDISMTEGTAAKQVVQGAPRVTSVAKAVLGNGTLAVLAPLNLVSESSLSGSKSNSKQLWKIPDNALVSGGVGTITSSVAPDNATSALTSTSSSSLLGLNVALPALPSLPVGLNLGALVDTLNATVDEVEGTVTETVDDAVATLNDLTGDVAKPVADEIKVVQDTLKGTLDKVQNIVANLAKDPSLLSIGLLESTNTITRKGSMVEAKATSAVGDISALGGLVTVEAVKSESFSTANGIKGAAAADTLTTVAGVKVGDLLEFDLTDKGLSGTLLGESLPAAAKDAVNTAVGALNEVLAIAGVEVLYGKKATSVAADGSTAASSSEGVGIVVNPPALNLKKPLLAVQLVPAGTAVNAARLAKPTTPRITPPVPGKRPLPRTGAELPLFAVLGSGVAAAALVARRRSAEA